MYGYHDPNDVIGQNISDFIAPEYREKAAFLIREMFDGNHTGIGEYKVFDKNGNSFFIEANAEILRNSEGEPNGIFFIERNITDRKLAEQALRESEEKYKLLSDVTFEGILIHDQGVACEMNEALSRISGFSREETIGNNIVKMAVHPDDLTKVFANSDHGYTLPYEVRCVRKDGSIIPIEIEGKVFLYRGQKLRVAAVRDITVQKQTAQALKENELQFQKIIHNVPFSLCISSLNYTILYANPKFIELFELHPDDIHNENVFDDIGLQPEQRKIWVKNILENGKELNFETQVRTKSGDNKWIILSGIIIRYHDQDCILSVHHDITKSKVANEALKEYSIQLENYNQEMLKANELVETALYQKNTVIEELELTKQQLQETIAEKDKFFSIMAHDLKSPFSGFLGLTKTLNEQIYNLTINEMQELVAALQTSADNVYKLLENLLEWSRLQRHLVEFRPGTFDLHYLADLIINLQKSNALNKKITINNYIPLGSNIFADTNMINTVLRNLISNSLKFTDPGGKIDINFSSSPSHNIFQVIDNGIGIPDDMINLLFVTGEKTSRQGTAGESSTGLGLLLCKEYIEAHHGSIEVQSDEGKGTTFTISLPRIINPDFSKGSSIG